MLKNALFSLVGVLVSLLLVELVVRTILIPMAEAPKWSDRPRYYYRPTAGLRDLSKKTPGTFRVAVVGDSITYGPYMQYDDVYASRLERMLNLTSLTKKAEVINYGVSGYSTAHEIPIVAKAIEEKADLILLQITLNDPELTPLDIQHENTKERFGPFNPPPFLAKTIRYWKSLGFVLARLHNSRTHYEYKRYFSELFENPKSFGVFKESLMKIAAMARKAEIPLAAVVFPLFGENINESYPFSHIHQKIDKTLNELEIKSLDLTKSFNNIPAARLQVIPGIDFHPNEIGHRIAAEKIYGWLRKKEFLPQHVHINNFAKR